MLESYNPKSIESKWYQFWEKNNLFSSEAINSNSDQGNYCIMLPPPNVTGSLHMGHAYQHTIMDCLSRHQRMLGKKVLWQPGTDHAGIATQIVVDNQLKAEGIEKEAIGRDAFVKKVWQWKKKSGGTITSQMRRLGSSVDWSREKFTLDDDYHQAVIKVFVKLYDQGLIYQGTKLINWDPKLKTAISDLEVESRQEMGVMYYVNYPMIDQITQQPSKSEFLTIATTRPETILADGAIALHPSDERLQKLAGRRVRVPMTSRDIPIISDEYVDSSFGTGCVKITPAHDYNDYLVGERHEMEVINLFNDDASMSENAPKKYQGLDRFDARKAIVADLKKAQLLFKEEKHSYTRPYSERSGVVVEPYLSKQWFIDTKPIAKKAKEVVETGEIAFIPENWQKTYFHWLNHIEDWCISRQLWWGHQIPAYYDQDGNLFVAQSKKEAIEKAKKFHHKEVNLTQDPDVLDTWFSSALWPFATLGWPEQTNALKDFYPTSVLVTGFDIIFFWVARMVMFGCHFTGQIPFNQIYITGLIRDFDGQKMSKSKGNVIDPIDVIDGISLDDLIKKRLTGLMKPKAAQMIEKKTSANFPTGIDAHGADALRFSFLTQASFGRNIRFDVSKIAGYRNFCNKIFNAAKYTLNLADQQIKHRGGIFDNRDNDLPLHLFNQWIISRLQQSEKTVQSHLLAYRLDIAAEAIYQFIWHEFCDWYLELGKTILNDENIDDQLKTETAKTTVFVFEAALRLLHPMMPFISEEIWQVFKQSLITDSNKNQPKAKLFRPLSVSLCAYPMAEDDKINSDAETQIASLQKVILAIRQIRSDRKLAYKIPLKVQLQNGSEEQIQLLSQMQQPLKNILNLSALLGLDHQIIPSDELSVHTVVDGMKISVILTDAIDKDEEKNNLNQKIKKINQEIEFLTKKLSNANFCQKAPKELVTNHQDRLALAQLNQSKLQEQLNELDAV